MKSCLPTFMLVPIFLLVGQPGCGSSDDESGSDAPDASRADVEQPDASQDVMAEVSAPDTGPDVAGDVGAPDVSGDALDDALDDAPVDAPSCTLAAPYSSSDADCNACAEKECCEEINGCLLDPACDDSYVNCILACSMGVDAGEVAPCIAICDEDYPTGKAEWEAAIGCADARCAAECG
jgi:hypothetical protein